MPFGKHKGIPMQDVPAGYLHWLWNYGMSQKTRTSDVADYIQRNITALAKEYPDGIWADHPVKGHGREDKEPDPDMGKPDKLPF